MPSRVKRKNDKQVSALAKMVGVHSVGCVDGLCLRVRKLSSGNLSCIWMLRVQTGKTERKKSLGSYPLVSLAEARRMAEDWIKELIGGGDPFENDELERVKQKKEQEQAKINALTLNDVLPEYMKYKSERDWKHSEETRIKEERRFKSHLYALLPLKLTEITSEVIKEALAPIWIDKPTTADRVLGN